MSWFVILFCFLIERRESFFQMTAPAVPSSSSSSSSSVDTETTGVSTGKRKSQHPSYSTLADELTLLSPSLKRTRDRVTAGKKQLLEELRKNKLKKVRDATGEKEYYLVCLIISVYV